jgi:hypothetical protein
LRGHVHAVNAADTGSNRAQVMSVPLAQPLYFGRRTAGWPAGCIAPLKTKRTASASSCAAPSGYEANLRSPKLSAIRRNGGGAGLPGIAFDYDGTGDSAGDTQDPDRVGHWLRSITMAHRHAEGTGPASNASACSASVSARVSRQEPRKVRSDVHSMIAFAPVIKVNSYLREIRALSLSRASTPPTREPQVSILSCRRPPASPRRPRTPSGTCWHRFADSRCSARPPKYWCVDTRRPSPNDAWATKACDAGAMVEQGKLVGYVDMMRDAHASKAPGANRSTPR